MELSNASLGLVAGAMLANAMVTRVPGALAHPLSFWGVQSVQLSFALYLFVYGLPGVRDLPIASWALGALFLLHVVQNFHHRNRALEAASRSTHREDGLERDGES